MKSVEYIIVGDGYAALFFAHQLIKNQKSFLLFSEGKKGASHISAGIINPVVLKRFTTFWLAQEQLIALKKTLGEIEEYTKCNYLVEEPILRVFHDEQEKQLWLKKSDDNSLKPFLSKEIISANIIKNPFNCGIVNQSARLNVKNFFNDMLSYLFNNGNLIKEKFDYKLINPKENRYKEIHFKNIVFAEGIAVKENPFFSEIPIHYNKGHHLEVQLSKNLEQNFTLKKKHFIFSLDNGNYYYGGTYDREQIHHKIDNTAIEMLTNSLAEFYPHDFEIKDVRFGFRPTVKDRRPIIGNHQEFKNFYVFNGLGARGILNGNYFSLELLNFIEKNIPLYQEVDIKRFSL